MIPIEIKSTDKILIIAPHPDDEFIGCGGMISLYPLQCTVVVLTDGAAAAPGVSGEEMRIVRKREFELVMNAAGVKEWSCFEFPDGQLIEYPDCMANIDFREYTKVFIPWGKDNHPDHTAACSYALKRAEMQQICAEIYQYEVHVPFHDPDVYLDISDVIENKVNLIGLYKSQLKYMCYDSKSYALAKFRACSANNPMRAFETFVRTGWDMRQDDIAFARESALAKSKQLVRTLTAWNWRLISGIGISELLNKNGWKSVSVFGFSDLGQTLYMELKQNGIVVVDLLDNRTIRNYIDSKLVIKPSEGCRDVDVVVSTVIFGFDDVKQELELLGYRNIISLSVLLEQSFHEPFEKE